MMEVVQNGTILPVSSRDVFRIKSEEIEETYYRVGVLTYHAKTRLNASMLRSGVRGITTTDFRNELRRALPDIASDDEQSYMLNILDALELGESLTDEDSAMLTAIESKARRQWPAYAELYADQYEWNRLYNWEFTRRVLCGIDSDSLSWECDHAGAPTDACLEQIPEADIAKITIEGSRVAALDEAAVKNSDSPSVS